MKIRKVRLRLQTTITLMICLVVVSVLIIVYVMFGMRFSRQAQESLENKAITIARTVSRTPLVMNALLGTRIPAVFRILQPRSVILMTFNLWL